MTNPLPKISIVTPSFNQGRFLDEAMRSVLDQGYPSLEYMVADGGSDDESRDVIKRHSSRLLWWVSERDGGQYDAINKGFAKATGGIMAWLNSDDKYLPSALFLAASIFQQLPEAEWLTSLYPLICDKEGKIVRCAPRHPFSRAGFMKGENLPGEGRLASGWIQQESTFWRRSLWERAGGALDASIGAAADFDLWARFFRHAELYAVEAPIGVFRRHGGQKTGQARKTYLDQAKQAFYRHGGKSRGAIPSALSIAFRRVCPNRLKPIASSLGLVDLGKVCSFDFSSGLWRVSER